MDSTYCVGCLLKDGSITGHVDGQVPECKFCYEKDAAIIASIENNEAAVDMLNHVDELLPVMEETDATRQNGKERRRQQRILAKKYAKRAPKNLAIANSKYKQLPANASSDDFDVVNKKCFNAEKKAIYAYQTVISIEFEELPKNFRFGRSLTSLISHISDLADSYDIDILETAASNDGQLVGLHCERCERDDDGEKRNADDVDVLQVKIGFLDKASKLDFIRKTTVA